MVHGQNPGPVAPPRSKRGGSKGDVRGRATARGALEKGGCVRVIEGEEVRGDDPVEYFLPAGVGGTSLVPEGVMAIEVPQNEEISGGGKNGERKGVRSAIRWGGANKGGIHLEKRVRGGVVKRDVDPYIIRVRIKRRKRSRKFRKE